MVKIGKGSEEFGSRMCEEEVGRRGRGDGRDGLRLEEDSNVVQEHGEELRANRLHSIRQISVSGPLKILKSHVRPALHD